MLFIGGKLDNTKDRMKVVQRVASISHHTGVEWSLAAGVYVPPINGWLQHRRRSAHPPYHVRRLSVRIVDGQRCSETHGFDL